MIKNRIEQAAMSDRQEFDNNSQNTHSPSASASMGIVLTRLCRKFFPEYSQHNKESENLYVQHQNQVIAEYENFLRSNDMLDPHSDLTCAIQHIHNVMVSPLMNLT